MKDLETESLWSHLLGRSMQGELVDTQLETLPSLLTDWESWKKTHPETSVMLMRRSAKGFTRDMYRDLGRFVVGMSDGDKSKAWSFQDLKVHPLVNDLFDGQPILIAFDAKSATPYAYSRKLDGKSITFLVKGGEVVDEQTGSTWDLDHGVSTDGTFKGKNCSPSLQSVLLAKPGETFTRTANIGTRTNRERRTKLQAPQLRPILSVHRRYNCQIPLSLCSWQNLRTPKFSGRARSKSPFRLSWNNGS